MSREAAHTKHSSVLELGFVWVSCIAALQASLCCHWTESTPSMPVLTVELCCMVNGAWIHCKRLGKPG